MRYRLYRRSMLLTLFLMLAIILPSAVPSVLRAQEEPTSEPTMGSEVPPEPQPTEPQPVDREPTVVSTPTPEVLPTLEATSLPETATEQPATDATAPEQVQGPVKFDVTIAPGSIKSGATITYTYVMTNTTSGAVNPKVRLRWVDFNETDKNGIVQYCAVVACPAESIQGGITVSAAEKLTINSQPVYQYTIGNLGAGQSARFSVRLRTRPERYPTTGKEPVRPAGSGELFLNDNFSSPVSQDTANTLIVGPVFVLTKAVAANTPAKVYPLETVEFTVNVGNATAPGDVINGRIRADAIDATNVTLVDTFPAGSSFVSAEGNPTVDAQRKTLTWVIPQVARGQTVSYKVRFKKENLATECGVLNNKLYHATSPQMPLRTATETYRIDGRAASHPVIIPLEVQSVTADPSSAIFGSESRLTIKVRSFYNQAITGLKLNYVIQSNAYYIASSATPAPSTQPGAGLGETIEWTFNMPAASLSTPATAEFSLRVRGGYTRTVAGTSGVAKLIAPAEVPAACVKNVTGRVNLLPRVSVIHEADIEPIDGVNIVEQDAEIPITIQVKNEGAETAPNVTIFSLLPLEEGADFSYVQDSSQVNGNPREPDEVRNGRNGTIEWQGINIPAGETITVDYQLRVKGNEFFRYCIGVGAAINDSADETVNRRSGPICVKINPNFELEKIADRATINSTPSAPGGEVKFTLRLTNRSGQTYQVGLFDKLGAFTYLSQESGYAQPSPEGGNTLEWPVQSLAPNQTIEAVIRTRVPAECVTKEYVNEALFVFVGNDGTSYIVQTIPRTEARVKHNCGTNRIEYQVAADKQTISLKDVVKYTVTVKNLNSTAEIRDIDVTSVLPEGFTFESMASDSQTRTNPQQSTRSDGKIKLVWRIPQLAANASYRITFNGRSGDIVGNFDNWVRAIAPNLLEAVCRGTCTTPITDQGETIIYSRGTTTVKPLHTALPELVNADQCAEPDEERTYSLSLINTNSHAYASTAVTVTLPLGLHFKSALGIAPSRITYERDGRTTLLWTGLTVPAKPANATSALVKLQIQLIAGRVFGELETQAVVSSPDGAIPRQDGIDNPKVKICVDEAALAKDASKRVIDPNEEFIYQIMAVNPGTSAISLNIEDTLPSQLTFVGNVSGANPTRNGNQLSWSNVNVPAAANGVPGLLALRFRVKLTGGNSGDLVRNTATVTGGTQINTEYNFIEIEIRRRSNVYLPLVRQGPR
jgi:uncharacterized repeat protein (TIGR01451 family)